MTTANEKSKIALVATKCDVQNLALRSTTSGIIGPWKGAIAQVYETDWQCILWNVYATGQQFDNTFMAKLDRSLDESVRPILRCGSDQVSRLAFALYGDPKQNIIRLTYATQDQTKVIAAIMNCSAEQYRTSRVSKTF